MLVHIKEIVEEAQNEHYAVGAFNIHNLEAVLGVARAAMRAKSPAIIQVSEGAIKYMGVKPITHIVTTVAKNVATKVPIALHLDHGKSFDSVFECINAGFTSVHIDASHLPLDENISLTQQVVEMAHRKKVWVQGEVGVITGGHGKQGSEIKDIPIAKLEDVVKFVRETKVDTIAAAVGTAHGVYENEYINFELLKSIKEKTKKPFVLHGGSGVDVEMIKKSINEGVNIINIGSDIKITFCTTLIKNCADHPGERDPRKLLGPTIKAVEGVVVKQMELFGSANQIDIQDIVT
jgi:fructose-bisphosphate aldolase class II